MDNITYAKNGQWSLGKAKANDRPSDADFLSYKNMDREGSLPRDYGQRGSLHGNPPSLTHQASDKKLKGKTVIPVASQYADTHPGVKPTT